MHLKQINLFPEKYPTRKKYPFNLEIFQKTDSIKLNSPVTFFMGENGTGKSTLLKAVARKCLIHIWEPEERGRIDVNPYESRMDRYLEVKWSADRVPGSFYSSELFKYFSESLDDWATADPGILSYFGNRSLMTLSHGQATLSYFKARFVKKGLYLLDEPETALSPARQIELLHFLKNAGRTGLAQFIIASHSPILLSCPGAGVYSFDRIPLEETSYDKTEHFKLYRDFISNREKFLKQD